MSEYRTPTGERITICNGCGRAPDGTKPSLEGLTRVEPDAAMPAHFPLSAGIAIRTYCTTCTRRSASRNL